MTAKGDELDALCAQARAVFAGAGTLQQLREARAGFLGRKGSVSTRLREIGALPAAERARAGEALNRAAAEIERLASERERALEEARSAEALRERALDVTLPGAPVGRGALHPLTRVQRDMAQFFAGLGFSIADGPEVETEWHCFDALRIAADHPSRDSHDTFFVSGGHVLRTHTTPVQIRTMTGRTPPFRYITPGRVFRVDSDATHAPFFHQIDGFMVDERVTLRRHEGRALRLRAPPDGRRRAAALPRALLPVHRAVGGVRLLLARRLARVGRLRDDPPRRASRTAASTRSAGRASRSA